MTQPEGQDSLYDNLNPHSLFQDAAYIQITEDMMSAEGEDYRDVGIAAKVHAAHLESQATSIYDSQRAFARISNKFKS